MTARVGLSLLLPLAIGFAACSEPRTPKVAGREVRPGCPRGAFAAELEAMLPSLETATPVALVPISSVEASVDWSIEPGCVVPFRKEPDERLLDVGRVVAKSMSRTNKGKPKLLGRGRLEVGRRALRLRLLNDAGDSSLSITVDGAHVAVSEKGQQPFDGVIALDSDAPLPLPLDALVAALDTCDGDSRVARTEDGNIIEARRGSFPLWRSRWLDQHATTIVDTSVACSGDDARLLWRTAIGDLLPMIAVASARSDRVLVIVRQGQTDTEDITDYGFEGVR